ncbi:AfsR/SARP family transcriptional regulator [Actinomycetes bacterium KLBMP 9797]
MPVIRMLGPLEIGEDPGWYTVPTRRKQRELLALLLARVGAVVSSDQIMDSLWGARPPASARANLHTYVSGLRQIMARAAPSSTARPEFVRYGYRLRLLPDECDATVFERLAGEGRAALAQRRPAVAVEQLTQALALWRGPVLEGVERHDWLTPTVARLEEGRLSALEDLVQGRIVLGQYAGLAVELVAATARHPLRERLWEQLMVTLHRTGRRTEALSAYDRLHELLHRELGAAPSATVRQLRSRILADT